jgi:hypothetical protein
VLVRELKGLGLSVELFSKDGKAVGSEVNAEESVETEK